MNEVSDIGTAVQRLLSAYDRLAVARRQALHLNVNEEAVLLLVGQGVSAPTDLSRRIGMTTAGVTNLLDRLEDAGHVRREPHQSDKRRILLTLTKRGFGAQLELESTHARVARLAPDPSTLGGDAVRRFLDQAADVVEQQATDRALFGR